LPLHQKSGQARVVAMPYYGAEKVATGYNVRGVAKASLESAVRYLAADVGTRGIRVNAISAGPGKTLAARGIRGFTEILKHHAQKTPLQRNSPLRQARDTPPFLAAPLASRVTRAAH